MIEVGTETNTRQFAQVVKSFFRLNPEKTESHLVTYVALHSNLEYDSFIEWRKSNGKIF